MSFWGIGDQLHSGPGYSPPIARHSSWRYFCILWGAIDAILSESKTKIEKMNGSNGKCDDVFWTDQQQTRPLLSLIRVHPSKTIVFYVYTNNNKRRVSAKREREKEFWETNGWLKHQQLFSSIVWKESHAHNNNHHVFIFISILSFFLSLHCLPI